MTDHWVELTITSVLSRGVRGGIIMAGRTVAGERYVARCERSVIPDSTFPDKGQRWAFRGPMCSRTVVVNGLCKAEQQVEATHAELLRPTSKNLIAWIAGCKDIPGIGHAKARKLYDHFGLGLVALIEQENVAALSKVISGRGAEQLCHAFEKHKVAETLLWLGQIGIQRQIGQKVIDCYAEAAREKIEANPYSLISFEALWQKVDALAQNHFGVAEDDPRRLEAAVEEALYRGLKDCHTGLPSRVVRGRVKALLHDASLVEQALLIGKSSQYQQVDGLYQPTGMYLIELEIARRLSCGATGESIEPQSFLAPRHIDQETVECAITRLEEGQGFALSTDQRQAVLCSASACLSLILGGAGTGKTTVLKALYETLEAVCQWPSILTR